MFSLYLLLGKSKLIEFTPALKGKFILYPAILEETFISTLFPKIR